MKVKPKKSDEPIFTGRFSVMQIPDFSSADAANIQAVKPGGKVNGKIKTVIENTKPEL